MSPPSPRMVPARQPHGLRGKGKKWWTERTLPGRQELTEQLTEQFWWGMRSARFCGVSAAIHSFLLLHASVWGCWCCFAQCCLCVRRGKPACPSTKNHFRPSSTLPGLLGHPDCLKELVPPDPVIPKAEIDRTDRKGDFQGIPVRPCRVCASRKAF